MSSFDYLEQKVQHRECINIDNVEDYTEGFQNPCISLEVGRDTKDEK